MFLNWHPVVSLIHEPSVKLRYYSKHMPTQRSPNVLDLESHDNFTSTQDCTSFPPEFFEERRKQERTRQKKRVPVLKPNIVHGGEDGPIWKKKAAGGF